MFVLKIDHIVKTIKPMRKTIKAACQTKILVLKNN